MSRWQIKFVWQLTAIVALAVLAGLFAAPAAAQHAETGAEDFSRPEKQELQSLNCGQTITADAVVAGWWASGCDSEVDGRGYARYYTFTLAQQSDVAIALESGDADAYLYLRDGAARSGAARHEVDDSAGAGTNSRIAANALPAGTYTVEATTYASGQTGDFTLTVTGLSGVTTPPPTPGPDLIVQSASVSDSAPDAGAPFTLSATVFNQGGAASAATTLRYYRSTDATITSCDTQVGTDTVTGLSGTSPALTAARPITADGAVAGQWASGCDSEVGGRGYARYYAFTLAQQSDVTIALESGDADAYLYLRDGAARSGAARHEDHDGGDGTNSRIAANALPAGTYTIEATTYASGETGDFTLTLSGITPTSSADCGQTITADGAVAGRWASGCDSEVDGRGYARYYTFTLAQQSDVAIALESDDADAYLYLRDGAARSGAARHEVDDSAGAGTNSRIAANALPAGTYTVEATTYASGETGDFTLTLSGLSGVTTPTSSADCGQTITADGVVAGQWASGCDSEVDGRGYARYYAFTLAQQSDVAIALESGDADAYLYLRDGAARSGAARHEDHDGGAGTNSRIAANALPAGAYTVEATTYASGQTGDFTLTVTGLSGVTTPPPPYSAESISLTAPFSAGTYYYGACVAAVAGESNTGNNCSVAVTVAVIFEDDDEVAVDGTTPAPAPALRPDLVVQSASVSDSSPDAGASFTLNATVRNRGGAASDATTLRYYRSTDATITSGDDTEVGTAASVDALAASASGPVLSVTLTAPLSPGTYYYGACVASVAGESNTGNNCSSAVTVTAVLRPDLVVQLPSVSNNSPDAGASFTLSASVHNRGSASSASTILRYYRSTDSTITSGDTPAGTDLVGSLAASENSAESIILTAPLSPGTYYYGACVASVAGESNTGNNCSGAVTVAVPSSPVTDRAALVALYRAADGANWTNSANWLSSAPIGEWYGVTTGSNGRVTILALVNNQLSGAIPPELGSLASLTVLVLYSNQLSGAIPPELGNLASLTLMYLHENQLSGAIPPELGNLASLTSLVLYSNQLSGAIPSQLGNLASLELLYLYGNQLSEEIPPELGNLASLTGLYLLENRLSGAIPSQLGNLASLTVLSLHENDLSGAIPPELGNLASLTHLRLNGNDLSGAIPPELGNLANLHWLYLYDNQLSGAIPPQLGNLASLTGLYLHENQLSGAIPPELGNLASLTVLYLYENQLSGAIPSQLGNLASLELLYLYGNQLSEEIPPELGNLASLTGLYLYENQLSGAIPSQLGNLASLTGLYLYENELSGAIPPELGNLASLTGLSLYENDLSEEIPPELGKLASLTLLALGDNELSGAIPPELGNLASLTRLDLYENELSGAIPPELGNLASLTRLYLNGNQLSGAIPPELGNLASLTVLSISDNQLSGAIPPELGNLASLTGLYLYENQLSEAIPPELGNLASLTQLRLHRNQLSEEIPQQLGNLASLTGLYLSDNRLSGAIPPELGDLDNLTTIYLSGNQLLTGCVPAGLQDVPQNDFNQLGLPFCGPDLIIQSPSVSNSSPDAGATFTLSATVLNQGTAASDATTLRYYRSADATITSGDMEVGTAASVAVLAASATSDLSVTLTAPLSAGTYYYGACVDAVAGESDPDNNCSSAVTVTVP